MSDSKDSAVTYTSVYTDSEPGRVFWGTDEEVSEGGVPRVIVYEYDRFPIQPVPQDEDEREPRFIQAHDPDSRLRSSHYHLLIRPLPIMSDSKDSAVTYTSVYTDSEPGRVFWGTDEEVSEGGVPRVIVYEYDGFPIQPPLPPVDSPTTESPGYVAESDPEEDPEYEDDEEQDGPVDYPMGEGDDGGDDDGDASRDDAADEDEDMEEEEENEEE
nr:hypothetical protein [Tanacetum cinerariifolium]